MQVAVIIESRAVSGTQEAARGGADIIAALPVAACLGAMQAAWLAGQPEQLKHSLVPLFDR